MVVGAVSSGWRGGEREGKRGLLMGLMARCGPRENLFSPGCSIWDTFFFIVRASV